MNSQSDYRSRSATRLFCAPGLAIWVVFTVVAPAWSFFRQEEGCILCHDRIENVTVNMGFDMPCTWCHGGDPEAFTKEEAHVQPTLPVIQDNTVPPLDYDLPYQQFINPSNLRVVEDTCGMCHESIVVNIKKSLMATAAGHYAGGLYQNGVVNTKTPIYGTFAITDDDGVVPIERGAVQSLVDLITYDPNGDPHQVATHFAAVPGQACARCHLWSRGKGYRGALGADGVYRADGCAACHMLYANDGLSHSADPTINHEETGHPVTHVVTRQIPTDQCLHCHHRGSRIGLNYTGRAQMPPRLPSGPGVPGTTDERFNGNYHYTVADANPPDIHDELGMHCIDCHIADEVMGDGNIWGHMDQATLIECRTCHGMPDAIATLYANNGAPMHNMNFVGDDIILTSKVTGQEHLTPQVMDIVDPDSPKYNPAAACAMNDNHLKAEGGLECYACHTGWIPNCFGCHFERDERLMGRNLVTREWEVGKVSTNDKIFETLRLFSFGPNSEGRAAPYVVACQPIADVTGPDGNKILDYVMPTTTNGLSGLALSPVNPHSVRSVGEVRTCVECHRSPPSLGLGSGNYAIARDYAIVAADDGLHVFDRWSDPANPIPIGTIPGGTPLGIATLPDVVEGTTEFLYAAFGEAGLSIFDLQSGIPIDPVTVVRGINAIDVQRAADHLYVIVDGIGIQIYDNTDPAIANLIATVPIPTARRTVVWGIHLLVAAGQSGLVIVNIADHNAPFVAGALPGINAVDVRPYAHYQSGSAFAVRAYVADPDRGVHIVDLLPDAAAPTLSRTLPLPGAAALDTYTRWVVADAVNPSREHDYLYVAAGANGLHVFDITEPDGVYLVAALNDLGGSVEGVDVSSQLAPPGTDDYALLANRQLGLQVVDVTNPLDPVLMATIQAPGAHRVLVEVQQLDRFIDEQGGLLKENSHPFTGQYSRADIVRILSADVLNCGPGRRGDMNCDGAIDALDIEPFILALFDPAGYENAYPDCELMLADINGDGRVDALDIEPLLNLLFP